MKYRVEVDDNKNRHSELEIETTSIDKARLIARNKHIDAHYRTSQIPPLITTTVEEIENVD